MAERIDVIVIGAGVAGIAATSKLVAHGKSVLLLEARNRIGGRIFTQRGREWVRPIELGAEFVHGGTPELDRALRRGGVKTREAPTSMAWVNAHGVERMHDFWERVGRVADKIPARNHRWSFAEFLQRNRGSLAPIDRRRVREYVQSFNAATAERLSAFALRADRAGADTTDRMVTNGYDGLFRAWQHLWSHPRVDLHLDAVVRCVRWRRGFVSVEVHVAGKKKLRIHSARAAIITLPLGVWRAGAVKFTPRLRAKQAIVARLGWGHVLRIALQLRAGFWRHVTESAGPGAPGNRACGFVNAPGTPVPVWWAPHPLQPLLIGWAGGPAAAALVGRSRREIRSAAIAALARILNTSRRVVSAQVMRCAFHDWSRDPFSRGAYSFAAAGAEHLPRRLAKPQAATLFFAGEATAQDLGTVHGALASGLRAAGEVLRAH